MDFATLKAQQKAANRELLHSFGLPTVTAAIAAHDPPRPAPKPRAAPKPKKPRVVPVSPGESDASGPGDGRRTSGRLRKRVERFSDLPPQTDDLVELESDYESDGEGGKRRRAGAGAPRALSKGSRPNPKVFGHIRGVPVGKTWEFRMAVSQDGIHAPVVAGISGNEFVGAWSVALSGGYEDDIDLGYAFTFTGSGGRDLKGTKANPKNLRTAPQSSDQEFTKVNAALQRSVATQKPVRVIRGYKGESCFAPTSGYRYDGLYRVTKAWQEQGMSKFKVCRFAFVRLDNQPDIPVQEGREAEAAQIIAQFGKGSGEVATEAKRV